MAAKQSILMVGDSSYESNYICDLLKQEGYQVCMAGANDTMSVNSLKKK